MAGEVRVPVFVSLKDDATQKLQSQLSGLSTSFRNFGGIVGKGITAVAGFSAAIGASRFIGDSIDQAKNLERSLLAVNTVFGDLAPRIEAFTKTTAGYGLSQSEAAKASTFLGSVLKQSGFDMATTAVETEKLVKLAADLSTTFGYDVQEALMGMTALFRGEYDPIEKFGVAMKQSEINSELAARGLDGLTGSERRLAEQQIRLELLYQRSTDAQGAFARGAGTVYVETEKLRANFENLQAELGAKLIPVISELFQELQPIITDAAPALIGIFEAVAVVIRGITETITELFDPTTNLGDSFLELGLQIQSLIQTIFGVSDATSIINGLQEALSFVIDVARNVVRIIEILVLAFQTFAEQVTAFVNGDWDKLFKTDWNKQLQSQIAITDAIRNQKLETAQLNEQIAKQKSALEKANTAWSNSWIARGAYFGVGKDSGPGPGPGPGPKVESQFKKVQKLVKDYQSKLVKLERDYTRTKFEINRDYNDAVDKLNADAVKKQAELLEQSRDRLRSVFSSAAKLSVGEIFNRETTSQLETTVKKLTDRLSVSVTKEVQSTSVASVAEMIDMLNKRLASSKALVTAATTLASKGFSQTFIEEVVSTGVETGNELANAILNASPEMQAGLKEAFLGLETVSETGLDTLVSQFGLATRELNKESEKIATELSDALEEKQKQLATALADAAYLFGIAVGDLRSEFGAAIDELDGKLAGLKKTIDELKKKMAGLSGVALTDTQAALTGEGGAFEGATVSNINIKKEALNASGIVLDSAADLASTAAYIAARVKAAETYIKSAGSNAAQDASARAQIASWTEQLATAQAASASGSAAGTTININVKTDSTQSVAMVGKTLGNVVTKYVTTGGQVLVSGTK